MGRRIEKAVTENSVTTTTRYLYDGFNIVAEYDENNNVKAQYIHNLGIDDQLAMIKNGNTYYYHKDGLGSVVALSDSTGTVVQTYAYDSFGNITNQTGSINQPYTFTGREYDPESGLLYLRARELDSKTGTFTQKDPIGFAGGDTNLYRYVGNNPVNFIDPLGLETTFDQFFWNNQGPIVVTDMSKGTTTFYPGKNSAGQPYSIETNSAVVKNALPGAQNPFFSSDVKPIYNIWSSAYGPGAYIDTGDERGRDIHGGGSGLLDPYAPRQGWRPTKGCTRGQNEDIIELMVRIDRFKKLYKGVKTPYIRVK